MATVDDQAERTAPWRNRRDRMRLECRECEAICERVVYPWQCLKAKCEGVYVYEDGDTMYFGCLYKVFPADFNLAIFFDDRCSAIKRSDPFGPVRVTRTPRSQCAIKVEQAYDSASLGHGCCNPTFFHHPFAEGRDAIKLTAMPSSDDDDDASKT